MFRNQKRKNNLAVNILITKGMLKRRRLSSAAILNITRDKSHVRVVK